MTLTTHHLHLTARTTTPLELDEQSGSAVRGAFSNALWDRFCVNKTAPRCADCTLIDVCPVAALVAPMRDPDETGGEQRPRPYVVHPPLGGPHRYAPGDCIHFGISVFGSAGKLFPYLVMAVQHLEQDGLGRKLAELNGRRGRLHIIEIAAINPLTNEQQVLYSDGQTQVQTPDITVGAAEVTTYAESLPDDRLTLQLLTPLRLVDQKKLVKQLVMRPFIQRLIKRLEEISLAYGEGQIEIDRDAMMTVAEQVRVIEDGTRWADVVSYSSRQRRRTPIGGLLGHATLAGDLAPLRELLVWGSLIHVGKNAVKGDGWYQIVV